jgi:hypothetical protein
VRGKAGAAVPPIKYPDAVWSGDSGGRFNAGRRYKPLMTSGPGCQATENDELYLTPMGKGPSTGDAEPNAAVATSRAA